MRTFVVAIMTLSVAQLFDLATFVAMVRTVGPTAEANPLVALLYTSWGYPMVAIAKVVLLALVTAVGAILLAPQSMRPRLAAGVIAAGILVGLVGGVSNAIALGVL